MVNVGYLFKYGVTAKLAVVIPTYNRPEMLMRSVLSALNQSYSNITVQIYDNSEGSETEIYLARLLRSDKRVSYFRHKINIGSIQNFQFGLSRVEADYFCLISDDDFFAPNFFAEAIESLHESGADFVCCQTIAMNEFFEVIDGADTVDYERVYQPGEAIDAMVSGGVPYKWSGIVFKSKIKNEIKINPLAGPYADSGFVLHVAARFKCVTKKFIGAVYMVHQDTASTSTAIIQTDWRQWWEEMISDIERDYLVKSEIRDAIRGKIYPNFLSIGMNQFKSAIAASDYSKAMQVLEGLNNFGYVLPSYLLRYILRAINSSKILRSLLEEFLKIRHHNKKMQIKNMSAQYDGLVKYAKEINKV
jgi:glycosyltransferase involved in cell wall biosynthesis